MIFKEQKPRLFGAKTIFLFLMLASHLGFGQIQKGQFIDGIAAVIGSETILDSEVAEQQEQAKSMPGMDNSRCSIFSSILNNKVIVAEAKKDTLIENRNEAIRAAVDNQYSQMIAQFPDEKTALANYRFSTPFEMKNAIVKIQTDQYYGQEKVRRITEGLDVTPKEVTDFYNKWKDQLPEVKDEVILSQIAIYPKLKEAHKGELIDRLKKLRQDILNGEDFATTARIYSEDKGSAANGGAMRNISKGQMVKPFEAAALNLQVGEISEPIETEFGYHIIRLDKKSGKFYDASHILLMATPDKEEIAEAEKKLEGIRKDILDGKITFKEAAFKYSDDKNNKYNGGTVVSERGSDRIEKLSLDPTLSYHIAGLNAKDITEPFETVVERKPAVAIIQVKEIIPAHKLNLDSDYNRIREYALSKKQNEVIERWVNENIGKVYISIDKRYQDCQNLKSGIKNAADIN